MWRAEKPSAAGRLVRLFGPSVAVTAAFAIYLYSGRPQAGPPARPLPPGLTRVGTYAYSRRPIVNVASESAESAAGVILPCKRTGVVSSESWGDYTVNIHRHGDDIFQACEVLRGGRHLYIHVEHRIKIGNIGPWNSVNPWLAMGRDITGSSFASTTPSCVLPRT